MYRYMFETAGAYGRVRLGAYPARLQQFADAEFAVVPSPSARLASRSPAPLPDSAAPRRLLGHVPMSDEPQAQRRPSRTAWASCCLGVSGSVAAVKAPDIARLLLDAGVSVDVVLTEAAHSLLQTTYRGRKPWAALEELVATTAAEAAVRAAAPSLRVWRDADEWERYGTVGEDTVLHVELAKRSQLLLIAPLCANTLASAALGLCSNLLGCTLRAWYYDLDPAFAQPIAARCGAHAVSRPVLVAPAMNTVMWHQRLTSQHLDTLRARGVAVVPPIVKTLACGDTGAGAMAEPADVVHAALELLRAHAQAEAAAREAGKPPFVP